MGTWKKVITVADDDNYKNENLTLAQLDTALDGANGYAANKILKVNSAGNAVEWDDDEGGIALTDLSVGAEQAAAGDGAISYDSSSGVFKYAPPVHDSLHGFVADEHIDHSGVTITAGTGLTGGGTIEATRTLNVAGGDGITANADDIEVDSTVVRTSGAQTVAGDKTFSGDCSFTGSTTYISTAELKVEDTAIVLAVPDSAYGSDNDAQTGADGAGILVHSDSTVADAKFAGITWNKDGKLTGWQARDTNGVADFAIAIMETSGDGTEPDGDAAGLGSLHFDTGDATLYVRTA